MKINKLLNYDLEDILKMNRKELSKTVTKLNSAANKRIKRMQKKEIESPAMISVKKSGGKFSVKNKNVNELRREYMRVRNFLNLKTSTVRGYNKYKKEFNERVGFSLTSKESSKLWHVYNKMQEIEPHFMMINGSNLPINFLHDTIVDNPHMSEDELLKKFREHIDEVYEQTESEYNEREAQSHDKTDFFDIGGNE